MAARREHLFGPCGRFALEQEWFNGQQIGWTVWDAEGNLGTGQPVCIGRHRWTGGAWALAARRLDNPEHAARTARGERWVPE